MAEVAFDLVNEHARPARTRYCSFDPAHFILGQQHRRVADVVVVSQRGWNIFTFEHCTRASLAQRYAALTAQRPRAHVPTALHEIFWVAKQHLGSSSCFWKHKQSRPGLFLRRRIRSTEQPFFCATVLLEPPRVAARAFELLWSGVHEDVNRRSYIVELDVASVYGFPAFNASADLGAAKAAEAADGGAVAHCVHESQRSPVHAWADHRHVLSLSFGHRRRVVRQHVPVASARVGPQRFRQRYLIAMRGLQMINDPML